jgi:Ran GTPase-activating protein (RanGAP) involved in mRNA processing and transport
MAEDSHRLIEVEKEVGQLTTLVGRIDTTLTKLTDLSTTVSQILAVQGNRLEVQEKAGEKLENLIETRRIDNEKAIRQVDIRIDDLESDLYEEIKNNNEDVIKEIKDLRKEAGVQHDDISKRMTRLEKWVWLFIGGGVVVGFILDKVNFISLFT